MRPARHYKCLQETPQGSRRRTRPWIRRRRCSASGPRPLEGRLGRGGRYSRKSRGSDLHAESPDAALLADALPAVRSGPGQGGKQLDRSEFSPRLPTGAEEDQAGLAGFELHHGSGRPDPASFDCYHSSVTRSSTPRGIKIRGFCHGEGRDEIEDIHLGLPKSD